MLETPSVINLGEYLTVGEAAEFLGVSPWTLRNWDKAGKLTPRRHPKNGYRIYRHDELAAILDPQAGAKPVFAQSPAMADWSQVGETDHFVQFYESDAFLVESVSGYIGAALAGDQAGIVVATAAHIAEINRKLRSQGVEVALAIGSGRLITLDAEATLSRLMVDGLPDQQLFNHVVGSALNQVARGRQVRAFGEMVALLWAQGNRQAAVRLEELWNELLKTHKFALFCAYPLSGFNGQDSGVPFASICSCHTKVIPAESYSGLATPELQLRQIALLQQQARSLEAEIAHRREAEQSLRNRERELTDFFENATEGMHRVGPDGTILWANKAELTMLGYDAHEYIGRPIADFHVDRDVIDSILARLLRGETLCNEPARLRCKDGSIRHVLIQSNGCFENGEFLYSRCFTRDITGRLSAEAALAQSERRFSRFMQHLPGLAWIKDLDGRYVYANDAAERAFCTRRADLYGQTDAEVFPPATAAMFTENDRCALASSSGVQVIESLTHDDGQVHHSIVSKFPIPGPDGQPTLIAGMAIDITERIRAEEQLREADRRKDEFLATLAHELRNPLAPLSNSLRVMELGAERPEIVAQARTVMQRQLDQMVRIVDDLLDVSRITRGRIELRRQRMAIGDAVRSAIETSQPIIDAAGHTLSIDLPAEPICVEGDLTRLSQVFANLLNNAAKYTPRGGQIHLAVAASHDDQTVAVTVRDTGIGIAADALPHVFEMFHQVDHSLERSRGGLGIGLTLVRRLVELHGGAVTAHSAGPTAGSTFTVRIPLAGAPMNPTPDRSLAEAGGPAKRRVLVVDDNVDSATSLCMMLRLMGNDVQMAHDGFAAIDLAAAYRPEVIFMDVGMPGLNGYDATRRIRATPGGERITIIALTGWGQAEDVRRSNDAGCNAHLVKPIDFGALEKLLAVGK